MADDNVCLIELKGLTPEEQKEVQKEVTKIVKKAKENADIENMEDAIESALKSYEESLKIGQMIQRRNAYLNKAARAKMYDYVITNWADNPKEGLLAYLVGTQINRAGGRDSVSAAYHAYRNKYRNGLMARLIKSGYTKIAKSGSIDDDIAKAIFAIDNKQPLTGIRKEAIEIAHIYNDLQNLMKVDANRHGAAIKDLPGYMFKRGHSMTKIAKDMDGWIQWMMKNVNWNMNSAADDAARLELLRKEAMQLASGSNIVDRMGNDETSGLKGFSSIAKRASKSRVFHFNTPEAEIEYAKKYGHGTMFDNIISNIEQRGRQIGLMSRLGPNAEMNLENAIQDLSEYYNKSKDLNQYKKMEELKSAKQIIDRSVMPTLTGKSQIPGAGIELTLSNTESALLGAQRWSLLGGSGILSGIIDPFVKSFSAWRRSGELADALDEYTLNFKTMFENLDKPEVQDLLSDLGVTNDYMLATINPRFTVNDVVETEFQKKVANIDNHFFYLNGQYFFDTRNRASSAIGIATRLGSKTSLPFDKLSTQYQEMLTKNGIDSGAWDIVRQSTTKYKNSTVVHLEGINDINVDGYLQSQGKKTTDYQRNKAREDIRMKMMQLMNDEVGYGVLGADDRLRAFMFGGDKSGSAVGLMRKLFWQFKQYPMSYFQKIVGREIYSGPGKMSERIVNLSAAMIATTIGGYIALNIDQLRRGKYPLEFNEKTIGQAMIRGGGLGIYGDFLYNLTMNKFGQSATTSLLGPTVGDFDTLSKALSGVMQGDVNKAGDNAARLVVSNIPFANIFYVKPILDYIILNQINEAISPGSLKRAESRLKKDYNQEYFVTPPSKSMLFK